MDENTEKIKKWDELSRMHAQGSVLEIVKSLENKKNLTIIDVGANSGTLFDMLCEKLDIGRAVLFEPQPLLFEYIKKKYENNDKVIVENIALSDCVKKFNLNDVALKYELEHYDENNKGYNLGLSSIDCDDNGVSETSSFDLIRKKYNLDKIDLIKIDTETEDLLVLKGFTETVNELKEKPLITFECNWWAKYTYDESKKILDDFCETNGYENNINLNQRGDFYIKPKKVRNMKNVNDKNLTMVTGLWDMGRGNLEGWSKRDFQQYKERFFDLLQTDVNMAIWIPRDLEEEVWKIRKKENTIIYNKEITEFKTWFNFYDEVQKIRTDENWRNFAGWLPESPQAALEFYNPMMMSKMFMLNDTAIYNPFNTDYFYWIDGGLTSTVPTTYFTHEKVLDNLVYYTELYDKFIHITYPYTSNDEIHGFERKKMAEYCGVEFVDYVARGGFFGGKKSILNEVNALYYNILEKTLKDGYMGADECLFTIMCYRYPNLIHRFEVEGNGLVWPFFENLSKIKETTKLNPQGKKPFSRVKTSLYVLTYNSPKQFEQLCMSFDEADKDFLEIPSKFLINNSTDRSTDEEYRILCEKYNFEEIKKDNIGICGGRQFVAEHFDESDSDYYIFFEDDMNLYTRSGDFCGMGFPRYINNLFKRTLNIIHEEQYDYLKLSFSEFFGDNSVQWAWYNIPQDVREKYFPDKKNLPIRGTDPNAPKTLFKHIKRSNDITYIEGNVHYDNWPLWFTRHGNRKVFLDEKWGRPYEQTWMSYVFQEQMKGNINSAVLLMSPINHHRFDHYPGEERREN